MGIEAERQLELHTPLGPDALLIRDFHGAEHFSGCFEYVLSLYSQDHDVDAGKLLGEHVSIRARCGGQPERYFDGIVCEFGHTGARGRYALYRMVLRPWLWLLSTAQAGLLAVGRRRPKRSGCGKGFVRQHAKRLPLGWRRVSYDR